MERIIDFFKNDYDYIIVLFVILLSAFIIFMYHKHERKNECNSGYDDHTPIEDIHFSGYLYGIFFVVIILCLIYLFFRIEEVIPNHFIGLALHL